MCFPVSAVLIAVCAVLVGSFSNAQTDTTPPSVTSVTPADATRNVSLHPTLQIVFSEPLDPNTVTSSTIQLRDTRNVLVMGTVTYNPQGNVATFIPSGPLLPTRPYTVTVVGGASGIEGRCWQCARRQLHLDVRDDRRSCSHRGR